MSKRKNPKRKRPQEGGIGQRFKKAMEGRRITETTAPAPILRKTLMMNKVRRRIYSELCQRPCISLGQIARSIATSRANTSWHVERLELAKLLTRRKIGRRWVIYPTLLISDEEVAVLALLSNSMTRRIFKLIRKEPDITQGELGTVLKRPRQAIAWHLSSLVRIGLVEVLQDGRYRRYRPTPLLDRRASKNSRRTGRFRGHLMKVLRKDGTKPTVVKSLARSFLVRMRTGKGTAVLEVSTDPYRWMHD